MGVIHAALFRRRILLAEDCAFLASYAADVLEEAGALVVGPVPTLDQAIEVVGSMQLDAAVYNSFLWYQPADALAQLLDQRGIPSVAFNIFTKFEDKIPPSLHANINWPFTPNNLTSLLSSAILGKQMSRMARSNYLNG